MGPLKTPRAFVMERPRARAAGVWSRSTPAAADWTQLYEGARTRSRSYASAARNPWSRTSTSSTGPSASPS